MKTLLEIALSRLARSVLRRYRPLVIGITGSVGKTSTKEAVYCVLKSRWRVRRSERNYNTEIGLPLAVLGIPHYGRNMFGWFRGFAKTIAGLLARDRNFPEMLVLEMGADRPGDIARLAGIAPPFVGVMTAIGELPVHVEFFDGPRAVAREKSNLIKALPPEGWAILNYDDGAILEIKDATNAHVMSYGFGEDSAVRVTGYGLRTDVEAGLPGISFTLEHGGKSAPVRLKGAFGKQQAYAAAAATAVGLVFNMDLDEIAAALSGYEAPPGRLKLLRGNKRAWILDDTYNASPVAVKAALEVLRAFPASRRFAVLGDMLELGRFTEHAHRSVGAEAARSADFVLAVGERMKFAADEARAALSSDRVFWFADAKEAGRKLESLLLPGDVVLVKGSRRMRMERIVEEVMAEPERAGELLVGHDVDAKTKP